ncbi:NAD-dependent aldehyde dehydrogenase [Parageobacillus genomosp. 1]|uniref:Aldehyde dehydrogenase n=1 Tax=Parageobacillus genomosp. 1 TaxID=1295642 RepID=A0ABC9VEP4_9BACL|nr:aldehyde dehydrogenase [Parageobacillus genomosp. 1]EZP76929.1 NAD-dependent aldehyde dehydrogenase [Parageobacillus genomosp. 1]
MRELLEKKRQYFQAGETKSVEFRLKQLEKLKKAIEMHENEIIDTIYAELNKPPLEAYSMEIGFVYKEISFIMKHLRKWTRPKRVKTPLTHAGAKSFIYPEPYGVSLIIAPWNYPFQLTIVPLVGAIAAGNCAVVKPSEYTPRMSSLLKMIIEETFPSDYISVVEGGVDVSIELLKLRFDHIFFTGSVPVGKIVMEAASKHLTPVTLELGGKSPVIVDQTANIDLAAKRIVWGKFSNAGQTCIAPDYALIHDEVKDALIEKMKHYIRAFYGDMPEMSGHYAKIVSERHTKRLVSFLQDGTIVHGGRYNIAQQWMEPTIIEKVDVNASIMQEEIFGPILPVFSFTNIDEAIHFIQRYEKPLALYLFSEDRRVQQAVLERVSFGGGCINDTLMHIATPYLPFGGVGQSGFGAYHGKASFDAFSHYKSILKQTTVWDIAVRYPNYPKAFQWVKRLLK